MFETSQVRAGGRAATGRATPVSISIAIHTFAVVGVVAASVTSIDFPRRAPDQWMTVQIVRAVPLPPPTLGTQPPVERPATTPSQPKTESAPLQPSVIPDAVTPIETAQTGTVPESGAQETGDVGVAGDPDGVAGGVPLGEGEATTADPAGDRTYAVGGAVSAPRVLSRVEPAYPAIAARNRMTGLVMVECIIDKQGRVRDVTVVRSTFGAFEQAAVEAVRQWTFAPGMMRGRAVDTSFHLTVTFRINDSR